MVYRPQNYLSFKNYIMVKKFKQFICFLFGHKWDTDFDAKKKIDDGTKSRCFCKRCGIKYHVHTYKK